MSQVQLHMAVLFSLMLILSGILYEYNVRGISVLELTRFDDGNDTKILDFGNANRAEVGIKLPKSTVESFSMNVESMEKHYNLSSTYTKKDDFLQCALYNIDVNTSPGSAMLARPYDDDFDDDVLSNDWTWINEPTTYDEGSTLKGHLFIKTNTETVFTTGKFTGHFLYRNISQDFTAELKVRADFSAPKQFSGIMAYHNPSHFVYISIKYEPSGMFVSATMVSGGTVNTISKLIYSNETLMRITKKGMVYKCEYKSGSGWDTLKEYTLPYSDYTYVGPCCGDGESSVSFKTYFDYFKVYKYADYGVLITPLIHSYVNISWVRINANTTSPIGTSIKFYVRCDEGYAWEDVEVGNIHTMSFSSKTLQVKAELMSSNGNSTPTIMEMTVEYPSMIFARDLTIDIGNDEIDDWNHTGELMDKIKVVINSDVFNSYLGTHQPDAEGNIRIPIIVKCKSPAAVKLSALSVIYSIQDAPPPPKLISPINKWVGTNTPEFHLYYNGSFENVTFVLQISTNNFTSVLYEFDGEKDPQFWSKKKYSSGDDVIFKIPPGKDLEQNETYYWRACSKSEDGHKGAFSEVAKFSVDTTPPYAIDITDDGNATLGPALRFKYTFYDNESDIDYYEYFLTEEPGGNVVKHGTTKDEKVVFEKGLTPGKRYYLKVRAKNNADLWSENLTSDGILLKLLGNTPPSVWIEYPHENQTVSSIVSITGSALDVDGDEVSVEVKIDDGDWDDALQEPSWFYMWDTLLYLNGVHTIYARATDGKAYSEVVAVSVIVTNKHEIRIIKVTPEKNVEINETETATFHAIFFDNMNIPIKYEWYVSGKLVPQANTNTYTYTTNYTSMGKYTIKIRAYNNISKEYIWNLHVININRKPIINIVSPENGSKFRVGDRINFDASYTYDLDDDDDLKFTWKFGDGKISEGIIVNHTYHSPGKYSVELHVSDGHDVETAIIEINVIEKKGEIMDFLNFIRDPLCLIVLIAIVLIVVGIIVGITRMRAARKVPKIKLEEVRYSDKVAEMKDIRDMTKKIEPEPTEPLSEVLTTEGLYSYSSFGEDAHKDVEVYEETTKEDEIPTADVILVDDVEKTSREVKGHEKALLEKSELDKERVKESIEEEKDIDDILKKLTEDEGKKDEEYIEDLLKRIKKI